MNVGEIISHKYEVLTPLNQDNLGKVYKARHVVLNTILALKVLPREIIGNPNAATRFYRQAQSLVRVRHPHLVQNFDIEQDKTFGFYYIVTDYMPERTPQHQHLQELLQDLETCLMLLAEEQGAELFSWTEQPKAKAASTAASELRWRTFEDEEFDDDQWEIGERTRAYQPISLPSVPPKSRRKTSLFLLLGITVLAAAGWWFGRSFLQPPLAPLPQETPVEPQPAPISPPTPLPLTFTRVEPQAETAKVTEGEALSFSVQASGSTPLQYEWRLEGKLVSQEPQWSYRSTAGSRGTKKVHVVVTDQYGQHLDREWRITVEATPPPPSPTIAAPSPAPPISPPVQKNLPPHIAQRLPVDNVVSVRTGDRIEFSALALDPQGETVSYSWSVDGNRTAQGEHFFYEVNSTGKHRVDLEVVDQGGLKDALHWEVQVAAPPAAPRITMYTPHQERVMFPPYFSRFFGVEVEVPGMAEPPIRYEWKIDNHFVGEQELLEIKNLTSGRHEVEVAATGPSGASIFHKWTVDIETPQESEEQSAFGPPRLEVAELDNNLSADKTQVIVKGRLRNGGERDVANIVTWISALDAQQRVVSRRLALPSPQPLVPGQAATFQTAFTNRSEIVDFHVEVVSK